MNFKTVVILTFFSAITLFGTSTDSLPPFMYDCGVRARSAGEPLNAQCDIRKGSEPVRPPITRLFYYSTDAQNTWNSVTATNPVGDRWIATTPLVPGNAHWRYYIECDSVWGGQTPIYTGASTCRLPANFYTYWTDTPGLDTSAYGGGAWLDIAGAGFSMSHNRLYAKLVKTNSDWRLTDGSSIPVAGLYTENYGYMVGVNNPMGTPGIFFAIVWCRTADPPGDSRFEPAVLKVNQGTGTVTVAGPAEFQTVAETLFMACSLSTLTRQPEFGTFPNNMRFINVQPLTMHLHVTVTYTPPFFSTFNYFADRAKAGHAYYKSPITEWISSVTPPNTPPLLTEPSAVYNAGLDQTTVTVKYSDADENPPEYVRVEIVSTRAVYELSKAEVVGPYGWITGIRYRGVIPGYHGWGAQFIFRTSDGEEVTTLPAGPIFVSEFQPERISIKTTPNPFNSACKIIAPEGTEIEIFDISGKLIAKGVTGINKSWTWAPNMEIESGIYFYRAIIDAKEFGGKIVYLK